VLVPKFQDLIFYVYSKIDNEPLVCDSPDLKKYICVFVNYLPSDFLTAIEPAYMKDLVEFAQFKKIDTFVISFCNRPPVSFLIKDYIEAARPK
jgi:hypothetical protein